MKKHENAFHRTQSRLQTAGNESKLKSTANNTHNQDDTATKWFKEMSFEKRKKVNVLKILEKTGHNIKENIKSVTIKEQLNIESDTNKLFRKTNNKLQKFIVQTEQKEFKNISRKKSKEKEEKLKQGKLIKNIVLDEYNKPTI